MRKITLYNTFHNTYINVVPRDNKLTHKQVSRAIRRLCNSSTCTCWKIEKSDYSSKYKLNFDLGRSGEEVIFLTKK